MKKEINQGKLENLIEELSFPVGVAKWKERIEIILELDQDLIASVMKLMKVYRFNFDQLNVLVNCIQPIVKELGCELKIYIMNNSHNMRIEESCYKIGCEDEDCDEIDYEDGENETKVSAEKIKQYEESQSATVVKVTKMLDDINRFANLQKKKTDEGLYDLDSYQ